jgi:hypothetical protein
MEDTMDQYYDVFHAWGRAVLLENREKLLELGFKKVSQVVTGGYTDSKGGYESHMEFVLPDFRNSLVLSFQTVPGAPIKNVYSVGVGQPVLDGCNLRWLQRDIYKDTTPVDGQSVDAIVPFFWRYTEKAAKEMFEVALPDHKMESPKKSMLSLYRIDSDRWTSLETIEWPMLTTVYNYLEDKRFTLQPVKRDAPFVFENYAGQRVVLMHDDPEKELMVKGYHPREKTPYFMRGIQDYANRIRRFQEKRFKQPVNLNALFFD